MNVNVLQDGIEENTGVYSKEKCSIPAGMGKYIPVQTNREIQGDVLIEISDNRFAAGPDYRSGDVMRSDARRSRSTI